MTATGRAAYAHARIRSLKSQLFGAEMMLRLRNARGGEPAAAADADPSLDRFQQLLKCYDTVLRSSPSGQPLFQALLRLHEIENLKLAWRAVVRSHPFDRWEPLWRHLGALATVRLDHCRDQSSLASLSASLRNTPYRAIAEAAFRAHASDLVAAELAFDRWALQSIVAAAGALGRAEAAARELAIAVVRERDLNLLRRGVPAFGLSPDAVVGSLVVLRDELRTAELARLAAWTPQEGRILPAWPRAWNGGPEIPADWDALVVALRRARRRACRRAFLGSPYSLAPAIALLLLQEEEVRGVAALQASIGRPHANGALERALAASAMRS
jgi:vacuolar-type H+-ATPase subunit C/Vma6